MGEVCEAIMEETRHYQIEETNDTTGSTSATEDASDHFEAPSSISRDAPEFFMAPLNVEYVPDDLPEGSLSAEGTLSAEGSLSAEGLLSAKGSLSAQGAPDNLPDQSSIGEHEPVDLDGVSSYSDTAPTDPSEKSPKEVNEPVGPSQKQPTREKCAPVDLNKESFDIESAPVDLYKGACDVETTPVDHSNHSDEVASESAHADQSQTDGVPGDGHINLPERSPSEVIKLINLINRSVSVASALLDLLKGSPHAVSALIELLEMSPPSEVTALIHLIEGSTSEMSALIELVRKPPGAEKATVVEAIPRDLLRGSVYSESGARVCELLLNMNETPTDSNTAPRGSSERLNRALPDIKANVADLNDGTFGVLEDRRTQKLLDTDIKMEISDGQDRSETVIGENSFAVQKERPGDPWNTLGQTVTNEATLKCTCALCIRLDGMKETKMDGTVCGEIACPSCHLKFQFKKQLEAHQIMHSSLHPYKCTVCYAHAYRKKISLMGHIRKWHGTKNDAKGILLKRMKRKYKGNSYFSMEQGKALEKSKDSGIKSSVLCPLCASIYPSKISLWRHMKKQHRKHVDEKIKGHKGSVRCNLCEHWFSTKSSLLVHLENTHRDHHKNKGTVDNNGILCQQCGLCYSNMSSLKTHVRNEHKGPQKNGDINRSVCEISERGSGSPASESNGHFQQSVNQDEDMMFQSISPNVCNICTAVFHCEKELMNHMKNH